MFSFLRRLLGRRSRPSLRNRFPVGRGAFCEPRILSCRDETSLRIGSFCSIARNVTIFLGGDHRVDWVTTFPFRDFRKSAAAIAGVPHSKGDVVIGNDVWIGYGATILSGVTIGNGAVIGACSLVARSVPAYGIVAGNTEQLLHKAFYNDVIDA